MAVDFSDRFDDDPSDFILSQKDIDSLLGFDEEVMFRPNKEEVYRSLIKRMVRYTDEQIDILFEEEYARMVETMNQS